MSIPSFQTLMLPVLRHSANQEISTKNVIGILSDEFSLSHEDRELVLPSGKQRKFDNRVNWAKSYLKQAGLFRYTRPGYYIATEQGLNVIRSNPEHIDLNFLNQFESYRDFKSRSNKDVDNDQTSDLSDLSESEVITPDEELRSAHAKINKSLAADLVDSVRQSSPQFFEELIVTLLLAMGYGGNSEDAGRALGQTADHGVDGVIDQDPLGVDQIYVQAKRYAEDNHVGAGAIRDFFGALNLKRAQKGIFFTTSSFTAQAQDTAKNLGMRIVLIDGDILGKLMLKYNVGCRTKETLELKSIDEEFFDSP